MLQLDATWMDNISNRIWPIPLLVIKAGGNRVYSNRDVSDITASVFGPTEEPVISFENRVISFGQITKKVFDFSQTIVQGFSQKTLQTATIVLNNSDREITRLIDRERWHNKALEIYMAYADSSIKLKIFEGVIQDIAYSLRSGTVTLRATETGYDRVFKPVRVGDLTVSAGLPGYISGSNEEIPVVYGRSKSTLLPDNGVWKAPFLGYAISRAFYAYAAHEVLRVPFNIPKIWVNGVQTTDFYLWDDTTLFKTPAGNNISMIETSVAFADDLVTIQGFGKPIAPASSIYMRNLIDIIDDFITVENSSVFTFDETNKIDAKTFLESTYFTDTPPADFAGVITQEIPVWTQIQEMLSGLGGSAFISSDNGELKVVINEFIKIPDNSLIISRGDILDVKAVSRVKNIYNSINDQRAWMPAQNEFGITGPTLTNSSSINIYGTKELTLNTKWSAYYGDDVNFLKSELQYTASRPLDIITCTIANPMVMPIEPGLDYLYLTFEDLFGTDGEQRINEFCKVLSIKFLLDSNKAELTVMDTNRWKVEGGGAWVSDASVRDMTLY